MTVDFFNTFELRLATTAELKQQVYKIRYQVYCEELAFEDKHQFKHALEYDQFDDHSLHFLIRHRKTGIAAGTARCVLPFNAHAQKVFLPSERFCAAAFDSAFIKPCGLQRGEYAEVSRIAISADFRRRSPGSMIRSAQNVTYQFSPQELMVFPYIALSLYFALASYYLYDPKIKVMLAMMEPKLMKHLHRAGIYFQPAGCLIDYHGIRQPFILDKNPLRDTIKPTYKAFFSDIEQVILSELMALSNQQREIA